MLTIFCIDQLDTSPTETLQNDLDKLAQWGMQFHPCTGLSTLSKVGGYFEKVGVERGAKRG